MRVMALANQGQLAQAEQELDTMDAIASSDALDGITVWDLNTTSDLMAIACLLLQSRDVSKLLKATED